MNTADKQSNRLEKLQNNGSRRNRTDQVTIVISVSFG